jgi:hypothetical protein
MPARTYPKIGGSKEKFEEGNSSAASIGVDCNVSGRDVLGFLIFVL